MLSIILIWGEVGCMYKNETLRKENTGVFRKEVWGEF
jgi:hypothetical protein